MVTQVIKRSIYRKSPLIEVVCQFIFPDILKIDAEVPFTFQDKIRKEYPKYQRGNPGGVTNNLGRNLSVHVSTSNEKTHIFSSVDQIWRLTLTRKMLSLSCLAYAGWESFRERLREPLEALISIYSPDHFSHICLRYRNIIDREELGLKNYEWKDLIEPIASGPLNDVNIRSGVRSVMNKWLVDEVGEKHVEVTCGLATEEKKNRNVFVIETHTYTNQKIKSPNECLTNLDEINAIAGKFFRGCVTEVLVRAFEPHNSSLDS